MSRLLLELLTSQVLTPLAQWWLRARALARRIRTRAASARRARVAAVVAAAAATLVGGASAALAESGTGGAFLDAFAITDSRGNPISKFGLSMDTGGITAPIKAVSAFFLYLGWGLYRLAIAINLWLFDFVLQFRILDVLLGPANLIASVLQSTVGRLGLVPIMLTLAFIAVAHWVGNGQAAKGIGQLILSLVMAALLASVLANPVDRIAGPNGLIVQARDIGVGMAASIVTGGQSSTADPQALQAATSAHLVDQFVRVPHQLINYGYVIDHDAGCVGVYDELIADGPTPMEDDGPRKAMADCDSRYGDAAENPTDGLFALIVLFPSGAFLGLLFLVLTVGLSFVTIVAVYQAGKFVLALLRGILPGAGRDEVFSALATFLVAFVAIIFVILGIGGLIVLLQEAFERLSGEHVFIVFVVMDLFIIMALIAMVIFWVRVHKAPRKLGARMSKAMSGGPAAVPTGPRPSVVQMGLHAKQYLATRDIGRNISRQPGGGAIGGAPPAGTGPTPGGGVPGQTARRSVPGLVAKGAWMATKAGVAYTVGAPVAVPRAAAAAKAAATAKKAQMAARLAKAGQQARENVQAKADGAAAYGREYAHNVAAAARFAGRASGATKAAKLAMAVGADPMTAGAVAGAIMFAPSRQQEPKPAPAAHSAAPGSPRDPVAPSQPPPGKQPTPRVPSDSPTALPTRSASDSTLVREEYRQQLLERLRKRRGGGPPPPPAAAVPLGPAPRAVPR